MFTLSKEEKEARRFRKYYNIHKYSAYVVIFLMTVLYVLDGSWYYLLPSLILYIIFGSMAKYRSNELTKRIFK